MYTKLYLMSVLHITASTLSFFATLRTLSQSSLYVYKKSYHVFEFISIGSYMSCQLIWTIIKQGQYVMVLFKGAFGKA